ncbi:SRPBCC family protein [Kitasatospora sp. NPDC002227]|uniref:SRPBCC family protein n=1 Tax=Kitasatospora sp. NPDC002227 TaxID=3154773 RepID=UPI00331EC178
MDLNHYRFRHVWELDAPAAAVYAALRDVGSYPLWWREVRSVRPVGGDVSAVVIRSRLPYSLTFALRRSREDQAAGVLEATLHGDLDGWSRWTTTAHGPGTRVLLEEEVRAGRPLLRRLAPLARPLFLANHALAARSGERGLRRHLAG